MTKIKALSQTMRASAAVISLALSSVTVLGTVALNVEPAFAQTDTTITADEATTIQTNLDNAIAAVNAQGLSGGALTTALESAIAQVEDNAVATYGATAAASVTSAVLAAPALASLPSTTIGAGLGQAAATIAPTQGTATATAIATTVANEAPSGSQTSFASSVIAAGGPSSVASVATSAPSGAGATGGGATGSGGTTGATGSTSGGSSANSGCVNPSCT